MPKKYKKDGYISRDPYYYKGRRTDRFKVVFSYQTPSGETKQIVKRYYTRTEASEGLAGLREEHRKKGDTFDNREVTFRDYVEGNPDKGIPSYTETHLRRLASYRQELSRVKELLDYFGGTRLQAIKRGQIKAFKTHLLEKDVEVQVNVKVRTLDEATGKVRIVRGKEPRRRERSIAGVNRYLQRLRHILREAAADDYMTVPSFDGIIQVEPKRKAVIGFPEYLKLIRACDEDTFGSSRDHLKLIINGLWNLGCRFGELKLIRRKDIDFDRRLVRIWTLKGKLREQRLCPLLDDLRDALLESGVDRYAPEALAFGGVTEVKRSWKTVKKLAGIDPTFRLHDLRRCFVTHANRELEFHALQKSVGHSTRSKMTADVYLAQREEFVIADGARLNSYYLKLKDQALERLRTPAKG